MALTARERDTIALVKPLGFQYVGKNGNGHLAFKHPFAGSLVGPSTSGDHRNSKNLLSEANKRIRAAHSKLGEFYKYERLIWSVPKRGYKDVRLSISEEVRNFIATMPEPQRTEYQRSATSLPVQVHKHSHDDQPAMHLIEKARGRAKGVWRIYGSEYALSQVEWDEPEAGPAPAVEEESRKPRLEPRTSSVKLIQRTVLEALDAGKSGVHAFHAAAEKLETTVEDLEYVLQSYYKDRHPLKPEELVEQADALMQQHGHMGKGLTARLLGLKSGAELEEIRKQVQGQQIAQHGSLAALPVEAEPVQAREQAQQAIESLTLPPEALDALRAAIMPATQAQIAERQAQADLGREILESVSASIAGLREAHAEMGERIMSLETTVQTALELMSPK